jgi:hypothetical protein
LPHQDAEKPRHHRYEPYQPIVRNNPAMVRLSARDIRESNHSGEANAVSSHECSKPVLQNGMLHGDLNAIALSWVVGELILL